ncbi:hypothetical protein BCR44DRAFT_1429921 [Catenaria anguillulae PL171]|uniref:Uncharacterized protein n=1 Tax=Catenaria anguillulae PL171 TaxID=765915 RepID=A0A1Y2HXA0_9FUNG|nr:hypothetical protein BCR44DRAFT_1429921 [Catenaria anguillulae PL171]
MVMASAGAIGIRRSPRGLLPTRSHSPCVDLVDQYLALERSPIWLAWIARGMPPCKRGENGTDAAIAYALGVSVDEVPRLRSQARWRAIHGSSSHSHVPVKREALARRLLRSTVLVSGWTASSLDGRLSGVAGAGKAKVAPVELARNGPVPPALEARELMRLRRRRSDAGKVSPWVPPAAGPSSAAVSTSFQSQSGGRASPPPPLPPFPVSTRAAVIRVGSDRGSMDTELSDTYVAPRRKDLLPRNPTSAARHAPFLPMTTDHIHLHGHSSASTSHTSNRHSSSSTSSSSSSADPTASLQDVLDPAMIVAEYGAVRLSPPPTLADDLLPDGRPRARSLPAGMLRYAAYMAAQRHAARMRREQLRAAARALGGHASSVTEDDLVSEGEGDHEDDKQVVDGEGNVIVAPVYRLPANRGRVPPLVKQPSVSTMRRGSASTATASMSEARGRAMPATLAISPAIDPDADTDVDGYSSSAPGTWSPHHARSRATSVSLTCPLPPMPMPATMPLPPTNSILSTTDDHVVDWYAHHEWHTTTPELAGAFPRRRASDVSTDLSSIIVVLDDDDNAQRAARHAWDEDDVDEYELHEIVVGAAPALAHVRSVSSPVDADWAVPAATAAAPASGYYAERTRSLSPPGTRGAARHAMPLPPLVQLTRPWPAAHRR